MSLIVFFRDDEWLFLVLTNFDERDHRRDCSRKVAHR